MLTHLQSQIAPIVGSLHEADQFALAGGAALIARGDVDRLTRDLDFFGPSIADLDQVVPVVEKALRDAGLAGRRVREGSGFYRLEVSHAGDVTEVDFGADFRLLPIERGPLGPILAGEELAVNKVLAVFGRAEARDFVDLSFLIKRYGLAISWDGPRRRILASIDKFLHKCWKDSDDFLETNSKYQIATSRFLSEQWITGRGSC